jgi:hypothetical protein
MFVGTAAELVSLRCLSSQMDLESMKKAFSLALILGVFGVAVGCNGSDTRKSGSSSIITGGGPTTDNMLKGPTPPPMAPGGGAPK